VGAYDATCRPKIDEKHPRIESQQKFVDNGILKVFIFSYNFELILALFIANWRCG